MVGELEPCPFCGASGDRLARAQIFAGDVSIWSVECLDCGAERASDESQQEADAFWNTRALRPAADEWQDIETAPKDGRRVILWAEQWTASACGIWVNAWTVGYDLPPFLYEPTHWRPLPDPPIRSIDVGKLFLGGGGGE